MTVIVSADDLPARLKDAAFDARMAAGIAQIQAMQSPHGQSDRFVQLRRTDPHRALDRLENGIGSEWDDVDALVEEYEGPLGRGWILRVYSVVEAVETSGGVAFEVVYSTHVGPHSQFDAPSAWCLSVSPRDV